MKIKTVTFAGPIWTRDDEKMPTGYKVLKITDSLDYAPNCMVSRAEVEMLCEAKDWKVTVLPLK